MSGDVLYAYGIVRSDFPPGGLPTGVDDTAVTLVPQGKVAALVSALPAREYAVASIEEHSGEVGWLSPRAMAHDRVLTWAQEHGGVVPLPMFSMWGSRDALTRTLQDRAAALAGIFARVGGADEFGLRIHRRDSAMLDAIDTIDEEIASVRREAAAASPGQRYLLERKVAERSKAAVRAASLRMARAIFDDLRGRARDAIARPLTPDQNAPADTTMVLNGAFLVARDRLTDFRAAVGKHVAEHEARGLSFDFTGPWPPYNFVADSGSAAIASETGRGTNAGSTGS